MVVIAIENSHPKLRGELTRWFIEVIHGVFVGNVSKTIRDRVWKNIVNDKTRKGAVMMYNYMCEQGFRMEMCGKPRRKIIDFDGVQLIFVSNFKDSLLDSKSFVDINDVDKINDVEQFMLDDEKWKDLYDD